MKVVVCCKLVPEEQDIRINPDRTIGFADAERKIGDYDLVALEAAARLVDQQGGEVVALSLGDDHLDNSKLRKAILSRGADSLTIVAGAEPESLDAYQTAVVLAEAVRSIPDVDVVVCGDGSADLYSQQVGIMLGELLGFQTVNAVSAADAGQNVLHVERACGKTVELLEVALPAALCVSSDFAEPRIVSMKNILAAGKKPVVELRAADLCPMPAPSHEVVAVLAPENRQRAGEVLEGDGDDQVATFVEALCTAL